MSGSAGLSAVGVSTITLLPDLSALAADFCRAHPNGDSRLVKPDCCQRGARLAGRRATMLNDLSSLASYLASRRSARPRDLVDPGPDPGQLARMIEIAARSPDHGKLAPWRFVHVPRDRRDAFAAMLEQAYREGREEPGRLEIEAVDRFAHQAPELVVLLSSPVDIPKIPLWEQQLSCGAVGMNLLHAAASLGFAGGWVTGWAAYSDAVLKGLGGREGERIAGFIFLGTPGAPLEERIRPSPGDVLSDWSG
jgi:nitroreductase